MGRRFANIGSPICKHWVADLQAEHSAHNLPDICPQQLPPKMPRSVSIEPVDIYQLQADFRQVFGAGFGQMLGRFLVLQTFEQQLQGFASIIANRQFYRFEHLKTGFVVESGSSICKHWVAGLQTLGRRFASRKICATSARHLPTTAAQ